MIPPPPRSTLFPYTTLFRSLEKFDGLGTYRTSENGVAIDASGQLDAVKFDDATGDRKSTRLNSSHVSISYAVFCLKKKKKYKNASIGHADIQNSSYHIGLAP